MNPSTSAPPTRGAWYADMEPWRRPVQLSLPTLKYGSDLNAWQWRVKMVLKHVSLRNFVLTSGPRPPYHGPEQDASATHCAALLASCISDAIVADLLTLFPEEDLEIPSVLIERTKRMVKAVQMVEKDGSSTLCNFLSGEKRPDSMKTLDKAFNPVPGKGDGLDRWRNLILVTTLVVKRYNLAKLTDVEDAINLAHDEGRYPDEDTFNKMMDKLVLGKGQK